MNRRRTMQEPAASRDGVILETKGLTKDFGGLRAVDAVDLQVKFGTIHSIIGPNGAGKTTLFNLLTGFLPPSQGQIYFSGKQLTGLTPSEISHLGIARTFQITSIFPDLTVRENVRIGIQSRTRHNYKLLRNYEKLPGVSERLERILEDVGLIGRRHLIAKNLSYGEKRSLEIAIALSTEPNLLLLDEPTSGMSPDESLFFIHLIQEISERVTLVVIEHNIDMVLSISDKITVLHQGSVIAEGSPEGIQEDKGVQEAYLGGY